MIKVFGTLGVVISLARLCVPYPTDVKEGVVFCAAKQIPFVGVLYELAESRPVVDDKQRFADFYAIVSDVYGMRFDGPLPSVRPLVKWLDYANAVPMSCTDDVRSALGKSGVLICRNPEEQRFLTHIYLNIMNSVNKKPLVNYGGLVPECFGVGMKSVVTQALVQKWAYPNRQK